MSNGKIAGIAIGTLAIGIASINAATPMITRLNFFTKLFVLDPYYSIRLVLRL